MKNTNILKPFVLFSFLLFYSFLIIGCSGEGEKDLSVYKDRATFENYLTEKINSYVEEHTSDLLDEETNIFTLQPARMFWQSFFEEDDQRINHWYEPTTSKWATAWSPSQATRKCSTAPTSACAPPSACSSR